jgi:hypothetical protein
VEVTGPAPQSTKYLYNTQNVFVEPHFVLPSLPASGSLVTSFVDSKKGQHWDYVAADQHLFDVFWNSKTGIGFTDVTTASAAPLVTAGSALSNIMDPSGAQHLIFFSQNNHVSQIFGFPGSGWTYDDRSGDADAPAAAAGSGLTALIDANGFQHFFYLGTNGHVYDAFWIGTSGFQDLTAAANAPAAAAGSALSSFLDSSGLMHVIFFGSNQHVYQVFGSPNGSWVFDDRTGDAGAPLAAAGSALTSILDSSGFQHFIYLGTNAHVYDAFWIGTSGFQDLTTLAAAPAAATASALSGLLDSAGTMHVVFLGANQHVDQVFGTQTGGWVFDDRTTESGAPIAAAGSALSSFLDTNGGQHFVFLGTNQHVIQANWIPGTGAGFNDLDAR